MIRFISLLTLGFLIFSSVAFAETLKVATFGDRAAAGLGDYVTLIEQRNGTLKLDNIPVSQHQANCSHLSRTTRLILPLSHLRQSGF